MSFREFLNENTEVFLEKELTKILKNKGDYYFKTKDELIKKYNMSIWDTFSPINFAKCLSVIDMGNYFEIKLYMYIEAHKHDFEEAKLKNVKSFAEEAISVYASNMNDVIKDFEIIGTELFNPSKHKWNTEYEGGFATKFKVNKEDLLITIPEGKVKKEIKFSPEFYSLLEQKFKESYFGTASVTAIKDLGKNVEIEIALKDGGIMNWDGKKRYSIPDIADFYLDPYVFMVDQKIISKHPEGKIKIINKNAIINGGRTDRGPNGFDWKWDLLRISFKVPKEIINDGFMI